MRYEKDIVQDFAPKLEQKLFYIFKENQPHLMRVYVSTCSMRSLADCFLIEGESITIITLLSTAAIFGPKNRRDKAVTLVANGHSKDDLDLQLNYQTADL